MKLNIFRNPFIDAQVKFILDAFDDVKKRETEDYWRTTIVNEILERIESMGKEDGGYYHVIHYCDVIELIELSKGKS